VNGRGWLEQSFASLYVSHSYPPLSKRQGQKQRDKQQLTRHARAGQTCTKKMLAEFGKKEDIYDKIIASFVEIYKKNNKEVKSSAG